MDYKRKCGKYHGLRRYCGCTLGKISGIAQKSVEKVVQDWIGNERRKKCLSLCEAKGKAMLVRWVSVVASVLVGGRFSERFNYKCFIARYWSYQINWLTRFWNLLFDPINSLLSINYLRRYFYLWITENRLYLQPVFFDEHYKK